MIINHNCCIKLVLLVIFIYDARSHIHQSHYEVHGNGCSERHRGERSYCAHFKSETMKDGLEHVLKKLHSVQM